MAHVHSFDNRSIDNPDTLALAAKRLRELADDIEQRRVRLLEYRESTPPTTITGPDGWPCFKQGDTVNCSIWIEREPTDATSKET